MVAVRSLTSCSGLRESKPGPPSGNPASMPIKMAIWLMPAGAVFAHGLQQRRRGQRVFRRDGPRIGLQRLHEIGDRGAGAASEKLPISSGWPRRSTTMLKPNRSVLSAEAVATSGASQTPASG